MSANEHIEFRFDLRQFVAERDREPGLGLAKARERHLQHFAHTRTLGAIGHVHVTGTEATGLLAFLFVERRFILLIRLNGSHVIESVDLSDEVAFFGLHARSHPTVAPDVSKSGWKQVL